MSPSAPLRRLRVAAKRRFLQLPSFAEFGLHVLRRFGAVGRVHFLTVPVELLADAQGDGSKHDYFREEGGVIEAGKSGCTALAGVHPISVMALRPRQRLRRHLEAG